MKFSVIAVIVYFHSVHGNEKCHPFCICLESYVDCSQHSLRVIPTDLPAWVKTLDMSNNSLHGSDLSTPLSKYSLLNKLKLDNNALTSIPIFHPLQNLSVLSLTHNRINEITSEFWENVPSLLSIDLSDNDFTSVTSTSFSKTVSLESLNLSNNKISNISNESFIHLEKLIDLKLSRNNIAHLKKDSFKHLLNLKKLELNKNSFTTIEGLTFKGLDKLRVLKLRQNSILTLQDGAFFGLYSLQVLKLDHNSIRSVSKQWTYGLNILQELHLSHNKIKIMEEDSWEACEHLLQLDLSFNEITEISPTSFRHLAKLQKLKMDGNMISVIAEGAFNSTPSLRVLELNQNHISWIIEDMSGAFYGLGQLDRLGLAANHITSINNRAFAGLTNLKELDLSRNIIKTIQDNAFSLMALTKLSLNSSGLICDCGISWFRTWLFDLPGHYGQAVCAYPENLKGKLLTEIPNHDFLCSKDDSPKPIITESPKSVVTISGSDVLLSCRAWSSSNSTLTFRWKRNNDYVVDQQTSTVNLTATLRFYPVLSSHAGKYQCIVSNNFGTVYSEKANLTVLVLPVMVKKPGNMTVRAGSTVKLECAANGEPIPSVGWQKDGGNEFPAAQERRMHVMPTDDVFYIINAKPSDSGLYSCIAKNSAGTVTANASLTVHEAPTFIRKMEDREVGIGKSTVLECMGTGWPKPKLRWWKDGAVLSPSQRHVLTADDQLLIILDVKNTDAGFYQCEITNSLGTEKTAAQLLIAPAYCATTEDLTGVIVITVVCCAVGTSAIWVIIIYQTRKRFQNTKMSKTMTKKTLHLDTKSEHSASSKDSGTGDLTKRSNDEIDLENADNAIEFNGILRQEVVLESSLPLLPTSERETANDPSLQNHVCLCAVRSENTRNNHDRCKYIRPCSVPDDKTTPSFSSMQQHNSFMCLYAAPKPTQL